MIGRSLLRGALRLAAAFSVAAVLAVPAGAAEPLRIGFGMALTGPLAANGKSALLAMQIWAEDTNAKGGVIGRKVELVFYDDQSNPSLVPGLYTKLLDVDKVDLVVSGYATNMIVPALPVVIQHDMTFMGLFGLAANGEFHYPRYFSMQPTGTQSKSAFSKGFFALAAAQNPKPATVAIVGADAEYPRIAIDGARENAKAAGLRVVYDRSYPPSTTDFTPIIRAIQATNPDIVFVASYPLDTVGMIRGASELGLKAKMFGGGMVGLQASAFKTQLGPLLNGIVNYDYWLPVGALRFPGAIEVLEKYQARATAAGVDPLGYYMAPWAYANLQVLADAVEAVKGTDQEKLAEYLGKTSFKTVVGDVKFGVDGEWAKDRVLTIQFQNVKGNDIDQFRDAKTQAVLEPAEYKSGNLIYPYADARQ